MGFNIYAMAKPSTQQEYLCLIEEANRLLYELNSQLTNLETEIIKALKKRDES